MSLDIINVQIDGFYLVAVWTPVSLWNNISLQGLALTYGDRWCPVTHGIMGDLRITDRSFSQAKLLNDDCAWAPGFIKIENGLQPDWFDKKCTCGAHAVFGKEWEGHSPTCGVNDTHFILPNVPKNNDGRTMCYKCGHPTKMVMTYCLCQNKKCDWYDR